jgi:hypothetical protein
MWAFVYIRMLASQPTIPPMMSVKSKLICPPRDRHRAVRRLAGRRSDC